MISTLKVSGRPFNLLESMHANLLEHANFSDSKIMLMVNASYSYHFYGNARYLGDHYGCKYC